MKHSTPFSKSDTKSSYFLCSPSPNLSNCFSLRVSPTTCDCDLTFLWLSRRLCMRARGYLSELWWASCPEESCSFFCSFFTCIKYFATAANFFISTIISPNTKPRRQNILIQALALFTSSTFLVLHSFLSISILPLCLLKNRKPFYSPAFFWFISVTSCISKLFEHIVLSGLILLRQSNSILLLFRPVSTVVGFLLIKFIFLSPFCMGSTNPK